MGKNESVVVAMSGGVDSSVAAALLKEEGYNVIGVTMQLWPSYLEEDNASGGCCSLTAVDDARRVANRLGIPYYVLNFQDLFSRYVIHDFCAEYMVGRTPNPCIRCNDKVKFEALLRKALAIGGHYIATGHYARIIWDEESKRYLLARSADPGKDQTYALYRFTQWQMEHTLLPLGSFTKEETREKAHELGLPVAEKKDSQEICFVTQGDYRDFLQSHLPEVARAGNIEDEHGNVLGTHKGLAFYTIGQRKGLGLSANHPLYVVDLDLKRNVVVVGPKEALLTSRFSVFDVNFIPFDDLKDPIEVGVKIRYGALETSGIISPGKDGDVLVKLKTPQHAVTPGQSAVFYNNDIVVGGGIIKERLG